MDKKTRRQAIPLYPVPPPVQLDLTNITSEDESEFGPIRVCEDDNRSGPGRSRYRSKKTPQQQHAVQKKSGSGLSQNTAPVQSSSKRAGSPADLRGNNKRPRKELRPDRNSEEEGLEEKVASIAKSLDRIAAEAREDRRELNKTLKSLLRELQNRL